MKNKDIKTIKINAENKILGRLATEVCNALRSKNEPKFEYNKIIPVKVVVYNAKKISLTGNKTNNKIYYKHSGYIGGLKKISYQKMFDCNPEKILYKAIKGMLPKNRLQKYWLRNLTIIVGEIND